MSLWTEGCEFTIAGHQFAIRRVSLWKDGFQLFAGDQTVCDVKRELLVAPLRADCRGPELGAAAGRLVHAHVPARSPASAKRGTVRPAGWFTRRRAAEFADDVPPPVQVFAIFLVLVVSQRQQHHAAAAGGGG